MLTRLEIEGFRTFREMKVENLARVNLFVGKNNAGKTSMLQALEILVRGGGLTALWMSANERGEMAMGSPEAKDGTGKAVDPSHLFHGHALAPGSRFALRAMNGTPNGVDCRVEVRPTKESIDAPPWGGPNLPSPGGLPPGPLALAIEGSHLGRRRIFWPLSVDGALYLDLRAFMDPETTPLSTMWSNIGTGPPDLAWLGTLWSAVLLGPEEERVTAAMRIIDPGVERIAFVPGPAGGFFVKLAGEDRRIPLGSMGEGMQRMLSLALHLVRAEHSYLLVDDIDTGLHHSVMEAMWRMVIETARRLDVQVFATTHSQDCVEWLGLACDDDTPDVILHQVNRGWSKTMIFTADEVAQAAEHRGELR